MYHKGERIAFLFNCYYIRYVLNTQMTPSAQIRTGRYSFMKLKFYKLNVCCAVESVFMNLSIHNLGVLSLGILKPVSQPLVIYSGSIRMRKTWLAGQLSHTVLLLH